MAVHPDTMLIVAEGRRLETFAEVARARLADAVVAPEPGSVTDRERLRFLLRAVWPPSPLLPFPLPGFGSRAEPGQGLGVEAQPLFPERS